MRKYTATEVEVKERRDRVEDALHATRAAIEEGIVPGGGVALLYAASALDELKASSDEEQIGINIVKKVLSAPIKRLVKNAGLESAVIIDYLIKQNDKELIYNVEAIHISHTKINSIKTAAGELPRTAECTLLL